MTKQTNTIDKQPNKTNQHRVEPVVTAEATQEFGGALEMDASLLTATGGDSVENQVATRLSDQRIPSIQRRALAGQIGEMQGNNHLQRMVESFRRDLTPPAPQQTSQNNGIVSQNIPNVTHLSTSSLLVQRNLLGDATQMSITPEYAQRLTNAQLQTQSNKVRSQLENFNESNETSISLQSNLDILELEVSRRTAEAQQVYETAPNNMTDEGPCFDPNTDLFGEYCEAQETLNFFGQNSSEEPQGIAILPTQLLVVDENGQPQLLSDEDLVEIDEELFPVLDTLANISQGGDPSSLGFGTERQVLLWNDGRAVIAPPISADLPTLLNQGEPSEFGAAVEISDPSKPWELVRNPVTHSILTSGVYQLGTYPISRFNGVNLPRGTRIRFANPNFSLATQTRMLTLFQPGTKRYFAWDYHLPTGSNPHPRWHINQKGMFGLFGQSNHAAMTPAQISQARSLRYLKIGGRTFIVIGVLVDSITLGNSINESMERGTPRPAIAETIRVVGGWGGAWAGAKLACAGGAVATIETGPGAVFGCIAGGIIGGFAGYMGADWIADMIEAN